MPHPHRPVYTANCSIPLQNHSSMNLHKPLQNKLKVCMCYLVVKMASHEVALLIFHKQLIERAWNISRKFMKNCSGMVCVYTSNQNGPGIVQNGSSDGLFCSGTGIIVHTVLHMLHV